MMTFKTLCNSAGASALAIAMTLGLTANAAQAQQHREPVVRQRGGDHHGQYRHHQNRESHRAAVVPRHEWRGSRPDTHIERRAVPQSSARQNQRSERYERRRERDARPEARVRTRSNQPYRDIYERARRERGERQRDWRGSRNDRLERQREISRSHRYDRNVERARNERRYDRNRRDHYARRSVGRDTHNWNRDWRRDRRYDWRHYRSAHRSHYRLGRYYAPYRGYSYRRISIGFRLGSLFYGNRYWINNPSYYRLPPAYGAFRWVRYYDDALLVNVYTGQVVDAIHDFFW